MNVWEVGQKNRSYNMLETWESKLVEMLGIDHGQLTDVLGISLVVLACIVLVGLIFVIGLLRRGSKMRQESRETDSALKDLLEEALREVPLVIDTQNPLSIGMNIETLGRNAALLDRKGAADAPLSLRLAVIAYSNGGISSALQHTEKATELAERDRDMISKSTALGNMGVIHKERGDFDAAFKYLSYALTVSREIGYKQGEAQHLRNIGILYRHKGESDIDLDMALEYFQNALSIDTETGNKSGEAQDLDHLGKMYLDRGDLDLSQTYFTDALNAYRESGNRRGEARTLGNLGLVHQVKGDLDSALRYLNNALMIHEELGNRRGQSQSLGNIGIIYQSKGNFDLALEYHTDALNIDREIGDREGEAQDLGSMGMIFYQKGNYRTALKHLKEARDVFLQTGVTSDLQTVENTIREIEAQM